MKLRLHPLHVMLGVASAAALAGIAVAFRGGSMSSSGLSLIRQKQVDNAKKAIGLNATSRTTEFEDFLGGPGETDQMKHDMALAPQSSTCELTARAILRESGFTHASLFAPYKPGTGIWPIKLDADTKGAWVIPGPGKFPKPGDVVGLDFPAANAHVYTVIEADPTTMTIIAADGGATDEKGHQSVAQRTHTWSVQGGQFKDHSSIGSAHNISGWLDVEKYAQGGGAPVAGSDECIVHATNKAGHECVVHVVDDPKTYTGEIAVGDYVYIKSTGEMFDKAIDGNDGQPTLIAIAITDEFEPAEAAKFTETSI